MAERLCSVLNAVLTFINGMMRITGIVYNGNAERVWSAYMGLQAVDVIYSLFSFAFAALCIYTRFRLSGFYSSGPSAITALYVLGIAGNIIYILAFAAVILERLFQKLNFTTFIFSMIELIIMVIVNSIYFKNRKHLFVN